MAETVSSILRYKGSQVWSVGPDDSVLQALNVMAQKDVGALVVMAGERLVGVVSERDYARKVVLHKRSSSDTLVRDIMTSPAMAVSPNHTVDDCMRIVTANRIRHLPVVHDDRVVGLVSIGDLVQRVISAQGETIQYLQEYIIGR